MSHADIWLATQAWVSLDLMARGESLGLVISLACYLRMGLA